MKFQIKTFWDMMPCSFVVGNQHFRAAITLHWVTTQKTTSPP